jgi:GMP synthase-like glutamine amidotransferase
MNVLSIVHGPNVGAEVFADAVRTGGHAHLEWSPQSGMVPRLEEAGAVLVFGGSMHVDQEDEHPWLRVEDDLLRRALDAGTPVLGICLGAQLLAKAAGAWVGPAAQPEIGWYPVELTDAAADDSVFSRLPRRFDAFQWHYYAFDVPPGALELARNDACPQAFRVGDRAWGVQFHPEVTLDQVRSWIDDKENVPVDWRALAQETEQHIVEWNELGRTLCGAFLEAAERIGTQSATV